ncbi:hypothetical protein FEM08_24330 [Flavobacterium gilvum]|nr:hypothetical protein FEM08_24330 [Flavobacterium gilvum]
MLLPFFIGFHVLKLWQFHFNAILNVESSKIVTFKMKLVFV